MKKPGNNGQPVLTEMASRGEDTHDYVGFQVSGYINKKGTPQGDMMLNALPPGMDIGNQDICDIRSMPLKTLTNTSYPGDGWGDSRDIPE